MDNEQIMGILSALKTDCDRLRFSERLAVGKAMEQIAQLKSRLESEEAHYARLVEQGREK